MNKGFKEIKKKRNRAYNNTESVEDRSKFGVIPAIHLNLFLFINFYTTTSKEINYTNLTINVKNVYVNEPIKNKWPILFLISFL